MFKKTKDLVMRKLKKPNFVHTNLPEGYDTANNDYRNVRELLEILGASLKNLGNYEHGGNFMKSFTSLTNSISSTTKLKSLRRDDIYTHLASVGEDVAQAAPESPVAATASAFSQAFFRLSEAKEKMNEKLGNVLVSLSALRKEAKGIDASRKHVEELRIKLEDMIRSCNYTESEKNKLEAEFNFEACQALDRMRGFSGEGGVASIMIQGASVYREFMIYSADALSKVTK